MSALPPKAAAAVARRHRRQGLQADKLSRHLQTQSVGADLNLPGPVRVFGQLQGKVTPARESAPRSTIVSNKGLKRTREARHDAVPRPAVILTK
jgi:hypothetical protein